MRKTPELGIPLLMMALVGCLAYEFQVSLPVMARQGLHLGATGYGFMTSAMGVGAVVGGLLVAAKGKVGLRPLVAAAAAFGIFLALATVAQNLNDGAGGAGAGGWREHRVHVEWQLDVAARSRAEHARQGDEPVVRGLPGLDADRRTDHRLGDGHRRGLARAWASARSPACWWQPWV